MDGLTNTKQLLNLKCKVYMYTKDEISNKLKRFSITVFDDRSLPGNTHR